MRIFCILLVLIAICKLNAVSQIPQKGYLLINDTTNSYPNIDKTLELKEFKNKVVYIDIWGTRCASCLKEFQHAGKTLAVVGSFVPAIFANPIEVSAEAFCDGWGLASYATEKFL